MQPFLSQPAPSLWEIFLHANSGGRESYYVGWVIVFAFLMARDKEEMMIDRLDDR